jgi:hypothetical protein
MGILLWSMVILASLVVMYFAAGRPSLSTEMALHIRERLQLVGPSQLILEEKIEDEELGWIFLGETDRGYCIHECSTEYGIGYGSLTYVEKSDDPILFSSARDASMYGGAHMPVFVFLKDTKAVSARLTLTTEHETKAEYRQTFTGRGELIQGKFFRIPVDITDAEYNVLRFWTKFLRGTKGPYRGFSGTATLELLDAQGNLIETIVLNYPADI